MILGMVGWNSILVVVLQRLCLSWFVYWSPLGFSISIGTLMGKLTLVCVSSVFVVLLFANEPVGITTDLLGKQDCPDRKGHSWRGELWACVKLPNQTPGHCSAQWEMELLGLLQLKCCVTWPRTACFTTSWENWLWALSLISMLRSSNLLLAGAEVGRLPPRLKVDLNGLLGRLQQWWKQVCGTAGSLPADAIRLTLTCVSREG